MSFEHIILNLHTVFFCSCAITTFQFDLGIWCCKYRIISNMIPNGSFFHPVATNSFSFFIFLLAFCQWNWSFFFNGLKDFQKIIPWVLYWIIFNRFHRNDSKQSFQNYILTIKNLFGKELQHYTALYSLWTCPLKQFSIHSFLHAPSSNACHWLFSEFKHFILRLSWTHVEGNKIQKNAF